MKKNKQAIESLTKSFSVVTIGLFVGVIFYSFPNFTDLTKVVRGTEMVSLLAVLENTDNLSDYEDYADKKDDNTIAYNNDNILETTTITDYPLFVDETRIESMKSAAEGILLLLEKSNLDDFNKVSDLFSDPISVEYLDQRIGVLTFKKDNGDTKEFPFVLIPDKTNQVELDNKSNIP
ncbi:MAG: hypothetical protein R3B60_00015 [Candidatus Paceibacterota bacterium]